MRRMLSCLVLLTICNALTFTAGESYKSASTLVEEYFRAHEKDMTLDFALGALGKNMPREVMQLLREGGKVDKKKLRSAVVLLQDIKKHNTDWTTEELDRAIEILNKMYDQEQSDLDITLADCNKFENTLNGQLAENSRIRTVLAEETSAAVANKLQAKNDIKESGGNLEELNEQYTDHKKACFSTLTASRAQLAIAEFDLKVAMQIKEQAECDATQIAEAVALDDAQAAAAGTSVIQKDAAGSFIQKDGKHAKNLAVSECKYSGHSAEGKANAASEGTFEFGGDLHDYAKQFKSKESWWAMQRAAKMALQRDLGKHSYSHKHTSAGYPAFFEMSSTTETTTASKGVAAESEDVEAPRSLDVSGEEEPVPASADNAAAYKCNVNAVPNCPLLSDAIAVMVGEIRDTYQNIKDVVDTTQVHCDQLTSEFEAQIKNNEEIYDAGGISLTESGKKISLSQFQSEMKTKEFEGLTGELNDKKKECSTNILALQDTMCGIKIVRLELLQMANDDRIVADCEVGDWIPDECSVTCGLGTQTLNRKVLVDKNMGAACPPLAMEQMCNDFPCPIDCQMDEWAGWGACTKDCGGGIQSRGRNVIVEPKFQGEECGETSETQTCNDDSCDADCKLGEWTSWSSCSMQCRGGSIPGIQTQVKDVIEPERGVGVCLEQHSPERFKQMPCNDNQCPDNVMCNSKLDIVVLFDGSGSVGSNGFKEEVAFGQKLIKRINLGPDTAKVGIVKYSADVSIVSPLSFDLETIETKVSEMTWSAQSTRTSVGMSYALDALTAGGREDADSIVFVISDGMPDDGKATSLIAEKVKRSARLIFVAVGNNLDQESLDKWASFPPEQNVWHAERFRKLDLQLAEFVAGMCPSLSCSEDSTGNGADYRGCQDHTVSGTKCQPWEDSFPHEHVLAEGAVVEHGLKGHNFCRNPDGDSKIWCYTMNSEKRWEYCEPQ